MAPATQLSIVPLPDAEEDTQEGCSPFVYGYYGLEPCFLRGVVRINHRSSYPLTITSLSISLKGVTSCSFYSSSDGDTCYREKIHCAVQEVLLKSSETLHPYSQLDIPFQLALPEPSKAHTSDLVRYAIRIANLLPPSTQFRGFTGGNSANPPFQVRTSYILTAELHQPPTFFSSDPVIESHALVEPFVVHDPRTLPLIMQPDSKRWRSAPGDSPLEFEIELSATTLGPGDTFYFLYRLAIAREAAARGIRLNKVCLVLREHRVVGTTGWGSRAVRGSAELHRWEFDESGAAESTGGVRRPAVSGGGGGSGGNANAAPAAGDDPAPDPGNTVELAELRPRRKLADGMTSYVSRGASAANAATAYEGDDFSDSDTSSTAAVLTSPTDGLPQTAGRRRRRFADGWTSGPGGDGLYAENEARLTLPQRYSPMPFPTPSFYDKVSPFPASTQITPAVHLTSPRTVFTPSSPRASDSSLLYPGVQPAGTPVAQVEVKHSLQVRVEMVRMEAARVRRRRRRKPAPVSTSSPSGNTPSGSGAGAADGTAGALSGAAVAQREVAGIGDDNDEDSSSSDASFKSSKLGRVQNGSGSGRRRRKPPDPIVMECWCVLTSVGRSGVEGLLEQRPELVPPLDYEKIFGGDVVWLPKYEERDSTWEDPEERSGRAGDVGGSGSSSSRSSKSFANGGLDPAAAVAGGGGGSSSRKASGSRSRRSDSVASRGSRGAAGGASTPYMLSRSGGGGGGVFGGARNSPPPFTSVLTTAPLPPRVVVVPASEEEAAAAALAAARRRQRRRRRRQRRERRLREERGEVIGPLGFGDESGSDGEGGRADDDGDDDDDNGSDSDESRNSASSSGVVAKGVVGSGDASGGPPVAKVTNGIGRLVVEDDDEDDKQQPSWSPSAVPADEEPSPLPGEATSNGAALASAVQGMDKGKGRAVALG